MSLKLIDPSEIQNSYIGLDDNTKLKIINILKNDHIDMEKIPIAHRIGYACVNTSIDATTNKTCRIYNCDEKVLRELIVKNLDGMKKIIEWNIKNKILLYRISSVVIPYASHEVNKIPWYDDYKDKIKDIGNIIKNSGMRVSMHPGQYVNINSPDQKVIDFSIKELEYHAKFMDLLELDSTNRMIIHAGGAYGDKKESIKRFIDIYGRLPGNIKSRLTIENDDKIYNIWDIFDINSQTNMPVIFDLLHHQVNHLNSDKDKDIKLLLEKCFSTWNRDVGIPKIHFATQKPNAKYGVHNDGIDINMLMDLYFEFINYDFDIMLETKDKELSVLRAMKILEDIELEMMNQEKG